MRKTITLVITFISLSAFSQKKDTSNIKFSTSSASMAHSKGSDTLIIDSAKFIELPDKTVVNVASLQDALKSGIVVMPDTYWYNLYLFMKTSKNGEFTNLQQEQMLKPFLPYIQRYEKAQEEAQRSKPKQ